MVNGKDSFAGAIKYFGFLTGYWPWFAVVFIAGIGVSLLEGLGVTLIFPVIQDPANINLSSIPFPFDRICRLFSGMDLPRRLQLAAAFLVVIAGLKGILVYANNIYSGRLMITVEKHFRMLCSRQLMAVGMNYFNRQKGADLQTICNLYTRNLGTLVNLVGLSLPKLLSTAVLLGMMVALSWQITLLSFLLLGGASFLLRTIAARAQGLGQAFAEALKKINSVLLDTILGMKLIRILNREQGEVDRHEREIDALNAIHIDMVKVKGLVHPLFEFISAASLGGIMILWSFFVARSSETGLQFLLTFIVLFYRLAAPVMFLNQTRVSLLADAATYREVFAFLDLRDKKCLANGTKVFNGFRREIEFRDVRFAYDAGGKDVLEDVTMRIPYGARIGIVGPSGSGKSTVTELLLRFYDPWQGGIFIDGTDLREFELNSWRRRIGIVSQDVFLFNDTIRGNIAFARPSAALSDIESAARKAHAHQFIQQLPQGYDTLIGDRGVLLSGGQRQRLAIARAILMDPQVLIFDEATSALDSESEQIVQVALDEVSRGRTTITIAHRFSTLRDCDVIFVVEDGRIVEQGTHGGLIKHQGRYARLARMQQMHREEPAVEPLESADGVPIG